MGSNREDNNFKTKRTIQSKLRSIHLIQFNITIRYKVFLLIRHNAKTQIQSRVVQNN